MLPDTRVIAGSASSTDRFAAAALPAPPAGERLFTRVERGTPDMGAATVRVLPGYTTVEVFGWDRQWAKGRPRAGRTRAPSGRGESD